MVELLRGLGNSLIRIIHHPSRPDEAPTMGSVLDPSIPDELRQRLRERRVPKVHLDEKYLLRSR